MKKKLWKIPIPIAIAIIIAVFAGGGALIYALTKTTEKAGPVGYWKFDEGAGNMAYDASGNANNGTLTNFDFNDTSNWTTGKVAGALKFDGTNDYVDMGDTNDMGTSDFTIEMWMKTTQAAITRIISKEHNSVAKFYAIGMWASGTVYGGLYDTAQTESTDDGATVNDGNWHHVVVVFDRDGYMTRYKDGVQTGTNKDISGQAGSLDNAQRFLIGGRWGTGTPSLFFNGLTDDVRIYNRALSAAEVSWNYNRGGPVGWWKFDEGSGTSAKDSSINGNTGTWSGTGTHWAAGKINGAGQFNGSNDYVTVSDNDTLDTTNISVALWVNPTNFAEEKYIMNKATASPDTGIEVKIRATTGLFNMRVSNNGTVANVDSTTALTAGAWNYIVITYDGDRMKHYLNGILDKDTDVNNNALAGSTASLIIGAAKELNKVVLGYLDDVRIYNYARSASEVKMDYNFGFAAKFGGSYDLQRGLVGYWAFEEGSGYQAKDSTLNANNGTLTNFDFNSSSGWTTGNPSAGSGQALRFDGTNDYVDCGTGASLGITGAITISAWVKPNVAKDANIVGKLDTAPDWRGYELMTRTDRTFMITLGNASSGGGRFSVAKYTVGAWTHIAVTWAPNQIIFYVSGAGETPISWSSYGPSPASCYIGGKSFWAGGAGWFDGLIDDVRIYNRALSADEIRYLYNRKGPVGWWKFDEGSGSVAKDSSINSNTGTWAGTGTHWATGKINGAGQFVSATSDYVNASIDDINKDAGAVSMWARSDTAGNDGVIKYLASFSSASLFIEKGTTNLAKNPSVETNLDYWGGYSNITSRSTDYAKFGSYSAKMVTGTGAWEGDYFTGLKSITGGETYSGSAWMYRTDATTNIVLKLRTDASWMTWCEAAFPKQTGWVWVGCTRATDPTATSIQGFIQKNDDTTATTWYVDGVQLEQGSLTTYCDGDRPGCSWTGTAHGSTSTRPSNTLALIAGNFSSSPKSYNEARTDISSWQSGVWHHVAATWDSSDKVNLYIDGSLVSSQTKDFTGITSTAIDIGRKLSAGNYFTGLIDDVRIYNYARTAAEIKTDYNEGFAVKFGGTYDLTQGLVGYWKFEEGSGYSAKDSSSSGNNGTLTNFDFNSSSGWTTGNTAADTGGALKFDGSNDYVDIPYNASLSSPDALTITAWIYKPTTGMGVIISDKYQNYEFRASSQLQFEGHYTDVFDETYGTAGKVPQNAWTFVTITFDSSDSNRTTLYINGVYDVDETHANKLVGSSNSRYIGVRPVDYWSYFNGTIDEVRIYNRALSADEIRYLYNRRQPIGHWKFDEGAGTSAYDSSINGNHGTFGAGAAAPTWTDGKIGRALSFDGGDYVDCGNGASLNIISAITVEAWMKSTNVSGDIVHKWTAAAGGCSYYMGYWNSKPWFGVSQDGARNTTSRGWGTATIDDGKWHHIVGVFDGDFISLYVDGTRDSLFDHAATSIYASPTNVKIGKGSEEGYYYDLIDDVRIYNYARTAVEIKADYNAGMSTYFK